MKYELRREDVFDFAASRGSETVEKGDELQFKFCPYCHGGKNRDKYTFAINLKSGAFKCLRSSCGKQGHFVELCRDFDYRLQFEPPKIYRQLPQRKVVTRNEAVAYLKGRGISEAVTKRYHITTKIGAPNILVFPFYDETGKLICAKYRKMDFKRGIDKNKEWFERDTMPILFGMDQCSGFDRLIITEGQIDSLSVAEAGFSNAVSVPTGASGFTWLKHNWLWITKFAEIIVFGDNENGHITLLDTLANRMPKETIVKAVRVQDYLGEKDANDILRTYGKNAIAACINNAEVPRIENVKDLADVQSVDINKIDKITTGIREVDRTIRGMAMGQLVILTGKRGEGKSTFMSQIVAEALNQKRTVFVYSGELADFHFRRWLDFQLAGERNIETHRNLYGDEEYTLPNDIVETIGNWYRGRAYIYDNNYLGDNGSEFEKLPETIERVIVKYNAQLICIDNLMTAMERVDDQNNLYLAQSNFVGRLKAIAVKYGVVILLVAHPRKNGGPAADDNDLVAGSADITNKADIVIKYQRTNGDDADSLITISKNRLVGYLRVKHDDAIRVRYSPKSKRITDADSMAEKVYGWERLREGAMAIAEDSELPF